MFEVGYLVAHALCQGLIYEILKIVEVSLGFQFGILHALQPNQAIIKKAFVNGCGMVFHGNALKTWLWTLFDNVYLIPIKYCLEILICYH